jgi:hypothetical protein
MENEKLRAALKELTKKRRDQGRNADHLLWLIRKLQRQQALGAPASRARSPSGELITVARHVDKYLERVASDLLVDAKQVSEGGSASPTSYTCTDCGSQTFKSLVSMDKGPHANCGTLRVYCYRGACQKEMTFRLVQ